MIRSGIRRLFRLGVHRADIVRRDVDIEIETHIAMRTEQFVARGLAPDAARDEALRCFGPAGSSREAVNAAADHRAKRMKRGEWMDALRQDLVYAARGLRRQPILTAFIAATFALGIGANAAMFGVADRLMLNGPAHVTDPDRVQRFYFSGVRTGGREFTNSAFGYVSYEIMRQSTQSFDGVAAYAINPGGVRFGRGENAVAIDLGATTADLFPLLGTQPRLGRFFTPDEDKTSGAEHVVVLGYGFWRREFAESRDVVGKTVMLNDESFTIVGVAPNGFTGPELGHVDVWLPMSWYSNGRIPNWWASWNGQWLQVVGRLKPGVSVARANADATAAFRNGYTGTSDVSRKATISVRPLMYARDGREPAEVAVSRWLVGVAAIVLIIACSNVVNLLLARALRRRREVAVRMVLGAGRARIIRLLVTESLMFALLGGLASIAVAYTMGQLVRGVLLPNVDWVSSPVNVRLLLVSGAIAVSLGIVVGFVPALQVSRANFSSALKASVRDGGHSWRLRSALTVSQAALSVVLLVGAGLFVASLVRVHSLDLGIQPDRVLVTNIAWPTLPPTASPDVRTVERARQGGVYMRALERLRALPGIEHASLTVGLPFQIAFSQELRVPGWDSLPRLSSGSPTINAIASQYFETVGSRLVRGRAFTDADREGTEPIAIVNETMAATLWPGRDPIGECIYTGGEPAPCSRIVGIAGDARRDRLREDPRMQYYVPFGQERGIGGTTLLVRPGGSAARVAAAIRTIVQEIDPSMSIVKIESLQRSLDPQIRPWRLGATVLGLLGVLALIVAAAGLYSVMSYLVAQRTHELGIRVALGASSGNIVGLVMRSGVGMAAVGVAIGLGAALALGRYVAPLLFETSPRDLAVLLGVTGSVLTVAVLGSLLPAMRAKRVSPMTALRAE